MARNEQGNTSSVQRPVLLATIVGGPIGVPAGASLPLAKAGKAFFIYCSFLLPRTLKMKHLMKACSTAVMAGAVSLAAWSPAYAQGEGSEVYSVRISADGHATGGANWVESASIGADQRFSISLKPGIPAALDCVATSAEASIRIPTAIPLTDVARTGLSPIIVEAVNWNSTTGETSPMAFYLVCVTRVSA